jgi:hypothetical protein
VLQLTGGKALLTNTNGALVSVFGRHASRVNVGEEKRRNKFITEKKILCSKYITEFWLVRVKKAIETLSEGEDDWWTAAAVNWDPFFLKKKEIDQVILLNNEVIEGI